MKYLWVLFSFLSVAFAWTQPPLRHLFPRTSASSSPSSSSSSSSLPAIPGADIEQPPVEQEKQQQQQQQQQPSSAADAASDLQITSRGKVNEIDFCIAPADVSLSRAYCPNPATECIVGDGASNSNNSNKDPSSSASSASSLSSSTQQQQQQQQQQEPVLSLTRALNNASNRAVRRILLARSWPSAEALNLSLRRASASAAEKQQRQATSAANSNNKEDTAMSSSSSSSSKCPVPRPILNVLMRKRGKGDNKGSSSIQQQQQQQPPSPRSRTDEEYVADQLTSFQERYGDLAGYSFAEAYLESILSLATKGVESPRAAQEVLERGVYDESYKRVLSVLKSVGVVLERDPHTQRLTIAPKLVDQDICWSMLDKLNLRHEQQQQDSNTKDNISNKDDNGLMTADGDDSNPPSTTATETDSSSKSSNQDHPKANKEEEEAITTTDNNNDVVYTRAGKPKFPFWNRDRIKTTTTTESKDNIDQQQTRDQDGELTGEEDLGGVLLSAKEPSMTRQLNVLSNIVLRAILFGGDQELLVLAETLDADRAAFVERWYPNTATATATTTTTTTTTAAERIDGSFDYSTTIIENNNNNATTRRPGVQYLNCLVQLLRDCYDKRVVTDLSPPLPLSRSYATAYERLVAYAVELGSGYLRPVPGDGMALPKPRTAQEELGRFAIWESRFRQSSSTPDVGAYPEDLEGIWEVRDEIGGETIGTSTVVFREKGKVELAPPLEGLRWRLDPGPTHLDTCTFQVLSSDGTILQYRGFIDRGARVEARFSKRPLKIRGSVMFQMRDGSVDYYKDMLPINYRTGTTKFVMSKKTDDAATR